MSAKIHDVHNQHSDTKCKSLESQKEKKNVHVFDFPGKRQVLLVLSIPFDMKSSHYIFTTAVGMNQHPNNLSWFLIG